MELGNGSNFRGAIHVGGAGVGSFAAQPGPKSFISVKPYPEPFSTLRRQSANPARAAEYYPPIPLERTCDTALRRLDGALSMARDGPDSAQTGRWMTLPTREAESRRRAFDAMES
jgi:hypothetical protein